MVDFLLELIIGILGLKQGSNMIVARTLSEMVNAVPSDKVVAQVGLNPKVSGGLHAGHVACVQRAKQVAQFVTVSFWDWSVANQLFLNFPSKPANFHSFGPMQLPFDEAYCLSWCESQGADVVLIGGGNFILELMGSYDDTSLTAWVDGIIATEGYDLSGMDEFNKVAFKNSIIGFWLISKDPLWRRDFMIGCWLDGYHRFLFKHFQKKYCNIIHDLIDPVSRADGLPFSTAIDFETMFNNTERGFLVNISNRAALISNAQIIANRPQSRILLLQAVNSANPSPTTIVCVKVDIVSDSIMGHDVLINVNLNGKPSVNRPRDVFYNFSFLRKGIV